MIDVKKIENQIIDKEKALSEGEHSLPYMLLMEVKTSMKRWFVISIIELVIILGIITGIFWYISLPTEDILVQNDEGNANYIGNDMNGEIYNGESSGN